MIAVVTLLEDRRQERLFPTTIGGGATTVELAHQVVGHRCQSRSLKLAGLASDLADRSWRVALCLLMTDDNSASHQQPHSSSWMPIPEVSLTFVLRETGPRPEIGWCANPSGVGQQAPESSSTLPEIEAAPGN